MGVMEIIFLVLGLVVLVVSFFLPAGKKEETQNAAKISEEAIREMVGKEVDDAKSKFDDIVNETVTYSMEKAERSMERLTNEKIMAVNEYSDTVLAQINKNHQETVFLYDMLNEKHDNLTATVGEASKTANEIKQTVRDAEITAKEVEATAKEARQSVNEMINSVIKDKELASAAGQPGGLDVSAQLPEGGAEGAAKEEFMPIGAERIEVVQSPEHSILRQEKPKEAGKAARKPRASKSAKKDVKTQTETFSESIIPLEGPEVAMSLEEDGITGGRNSNERILELHKAGKSNMAIAKELGLGIGEVKLVIDLFEGI